MKINHIGIYVKNVEKVLEFYQSFFQAKLVRKNINKNTNVTVSFLRIENAELEFLFDPKINLSNNLKYHIAFEVKSEEEVDFFYNRACNYELNILYRPRESSLCDYVFSFEDIEYNKIEIICPSCKRESFYNPFMKNKSLLPITSLNKLTIHYEQESIKLIDLINNVNKGCKAEEPDDIESYANIFFDFIYNLKFHCLNLTHPDWEEMHWNYWKIIDCISFCGGILNCELGNKFMQCLIQNINNSSLALSVKQISFPAFASVIGGGKFMSCYSDHSYIFDFGHTNIKRGLLEKKEDIYYIHLLDSIPAKYIEWLENPKQKDALLLHQYIMKVIIQTIKNDPCHDEKQIHIFISIANYVREGSLFTRGGYGKLTLLHDNYSTYLQNELSKMLNKKIILYLMHDATSATYCVNSDEGNTAVISFGTSIGVSFVQKDVLQEKIQNNNYEIIERNTNQVIRIKNMESD